MLPFSIHLHEPWLPEQRAAFLRDTGPSPEAADSLLCGDELSAVSPGLRAALCTNNSVRHLDDGHQRERLFRFHAQGGGGLAAVTCLLLMNTPGPRVHPKRARRLAGNEAGDALPMGEPQGRG